MWSNYKLWQHHFETLLLLEIQWIAHTLCNSIKWLDNLVLNTPLCKYFTLRRIGYKLHSGYRTLCIFHLKSGLDCFNCKFPSFDSSYIYESQRIQECSHDYQSNELRIQINGSIFGTQILLRKVFHPWT